MPTRMSIQARAMSSSESCCTRTTTALRSSQCISVLTLFFFFQAEDGIRDLTVTGVQTCALPIFGERHQRAAQSRRAVREHTLQQFAVMCRRVAGADLGIRWAATVPSLCGVP